MLEKVFPMAQRHTALLFFAGMTCVLTAGTTAAEKTIHLNFNWPNAVKAKVTVETFIDTTNFGKEFKLSDRVNYAFESTSTAEGFLIVERDHSIVDQQSNGKALDPAITIRDIGLVPALYRGEYLVAANGDFLDVHNFVVTYCETNATRFAHLKRNPNIPAEIASCRARVENQTDPLVHYAHQLALNQASAEWTRIVSWWAGESMTEGEVYEFQTMLPEGASPEKAIPTTDTSRFVGRFPCKEGGAGEECVQLEWISLSDTGPTPKPIVDVIGVVNPALLPTQAPSGDPVLGSLRKRTEVRLLTDTASLLPQWLEVVESLTVTVNDETNRTIHTKTRSVWTYEYEQPN